MTTFLKIIENIGWPLSLLLFPGTFLNCADTKNQNMQNKTANVFYSLSKYCKPFQKIWKSTPWKNYF